MPRFKAQRQGLWVRVTLLFTLLFTVALLLVLAITLLIGKAHLQAQVHDQVEAEVRFLLAEFAEDGLAELLEETEERIEKNPADRRFRYLIQNTQGEVLFDPFPPPGGQLGWQQVNSPAASGEAHYLFYYHRLDSEHLLGVGASLASVQAFQSAIGRAFLATLLCALGIGLAAGFTLGTWMSRRLSLLQTALQQVAAGQWHMRLPEDPGGHEWAQLTRALNRLFSHLEQAISNLKYISAGLAHDLRTPITRLHNRISALQTSAGGQPIDAVHLESLQQELSALLQYFDAALLINELQSGSLANHFEPIELSALVQAILEDYSPLLEDAQINLTCALTAPMRVRGMASLLRRMLANLLDNVVKHGGQACQLQIRLHHSAQEPPRACLCIDNTRTGNDSTANPYNLPPGVERKKMGQHIITAIVTAHGGQCSFSSDTHGHHCQIELPLVGSQNEGA